VPVCQNSKTNDVTSFYPAGSTPTLTLVANPHYYGRHPKLKLVIPAIADNQTGYSDFKSGNLDLTWSVPSNVQASVRGKPGVHQYGSSGIEYLAPNLNQKPFDNLHCRLALAESIDRNTLVNQVLHRAYKPLYTVVPPGFIGFYNAAKTTPHYNLTEAKKQLAQCPGGIHITYYYRNDTTDRRASAAALQAMWQSAGLDVKIDGHPRADWLKVILQPLKNTNTAVAYDDWFMDFPDPQDYLDILLRSGQPQNCEGWNNKTYDQLVTKGNTAPTVAQRAKYYIQAQKLVLKEAAFIPVDNFTNFDMLNPKIKGMQPNFAQGVEWPINNDWANVSKS
jgi:ABC-type oligopeptide transport system substrate-binding subunit